MKKALVLISLISLFLFSLPVIGQTSREEIFETIEKGGGVYYAYPGPSANNNTPAPKGYKPFYISHYGRHGSRYLISGKDYTSVLAVFDKAHAAGALTALGEDVRTRLVEVCKEGAETAGDLTPLGRRQHRGIAERMFRSFPEVFADGDSISARSTVVPRCAMSMVAFGDRLKELNPKLNILYEMSDRYMGYMNYHTDESNRFTNGETGYLAEEIRKYKEERTNPDRLIASLFSDEDFIRMSVNPSSLMWGLYWIASDMQNMETKQSFFDIFTKEEIFDLWEFNNYRWYAGNANHSAGKGIVVANAKNLLRNIVESADEAIEKHNVAATLRFGHDGNVVPLAAILHLEDCNVAMSEHTEVYKYWSDFKIVPMAGNIQMIFFEKKGGSADDVLVKFMLNEKEVKVPVETDIFPFYRWKDVRKFYMSLF